MASRLALMAIRAGGEAEAPSSTCRRGPPNDALLLAPGAHRSEQSRSKRDAVRSHPQFARLVRESEGVGRGSVPCPHETTAFDAVAAERSARTARITPVRMPSLGNQKRRRPDAASSRRAAHRPDLNVEATLRRANRKAAQESSRSEANLTVRRSTARHHPGSNVVRPGAEDDAPLGHAVARSRAHTRRRARSPGGSIVPVSFGRGIRAQHAWAEAGSGPSSPSTVTRPAS